MSAQPRHGRPHFPEGVLVWAGAAAFAIAWSIANGRDLNWDFLNYHVYAGFASLNDRLAQDYFPANVQSYMHGHAYVPLYLMIATGLSTAAVQALLGLMSVPAIVASWYLARRVLPGAGVEAASWRLGMVAAAAASPLFLMELGTSFADGWTAALVIASLVLALPQDREGRWRAALVSGLLAGIACALKMTNSAMVLGIGVVWLLCQQGGWRRNLACAFAFGAAAAAGFLLVYGHWGWTLYQRFGNPFFPLLANETFRAPEYLQASVVLDRFRPFGAWEALMRPVFMMDPVANVYTEARAPDTRFIAAILLCVGYAIERARRHLDGDRPLMALLVWCVVTWAAWLFTSGNGRYGIALALGTGVLAIALAEQLWHARSGHIFAIKALCVVLLALQVISMTLTVFRWDGRQDKSPRYFAPIPDKVLVEKPHVIVNLDFQSVSWLAPFVHPASRFVSPAGQYTIAPESAAGGKLTEVLRSGLPVLLVQKVQTTTRTPLESLPLLERLSPYQKLYGLDVLPGACHHVLMDRTEGRIHAGSDVELDDNVRNILLLCPVKYDAALSRRTQAAFAEGDEVFRRIEAACPRLFGPPGAQTVCNDNFCGRIYLNSDNNLHLFRDGGIVATGFNGIQPAFVGTREGILAGEKPMCPARLGRYQPFTAGGSAFAPPQ